MKNRTAILGYYHGPKLGVGVYIDKFINHLSDQTRRKCQFVLYTNRNTVKNFSRLPSNIDIVILPMLGAGSIIGILWSALIFPLVCLFRGYKAAIVLTNPIILLPLLRYIIVIHDLNEFEMPEKYGKIRTLYRKKIMLPSSFRYADSIVAISHFVKKQINKYFPSLPDKKLTVIPNGVDVKISRSAVNENAFNSLHLPQFQYYLVVGRIDPRGKNLYKTLELYLKLEQGHPGHKLILVGDVNEFVAEEAHDFLELTATDPRYVGKVLYWGHVDDITLASFYKNATAVIFFSRFEGFGFPLIEAFNQGCPVIVNSACEVLAELSEGAAIAIDEESFLARSEFQINAIFDKIKRAELATRMKIVGQKYDWRKTIGAYIDLIEETAGAPR